MNPTGRYEHTFRENIDAQTVSTDGRATLYANDQTYMFGRKEM
jgi:hypothetical protein